MRKVLLLVMSLVTTCGVYAAQSSIPFTISGEIADGNSYVEVTMIKLYQSWVTEMAGEQNVPVSDGKFEYSDELKHAGNVIVSLKAEGKERKTIQLFISGGTVHVRLGEDGKFKVSGNKDAEDEYYKLRGPVDHYNSMTSDLSDKLEKAKLAGTDTVAIKSELIKAIDACFQVPEDYIKANPASPVAIYALFYMGSGGKIGKPLTLNDLESLYMSISPEIRNSDYGKKYAGSLKLWKAKGEHPVTWTTTISRINKKEALITFTANISGGWHIYSPYLEKDHRSKFTFEESADFELNGGINEQSTFVNKKFNYYGRSYDLKWFESPAVFTQKIDLKTSKPVTIKGSVEYTTNKDEYGLPLLSLAPKKFEFNVEVPRK